MPKTFGILLWAVINVSGPASIGAADLAIRIPPTDALVGTEIKVPILIEGAVDLGAIEFNLVYEPSLVEFLALEAGRMNGGMVDFKLIRPGLVRIGSIAEPSLNGDGELIVIAFKVLLSGTGALEFDRLKANAGTSGAEIPTKPQPGTLNAHAAVPPTANLPAAKPAPVTTATADYIPPSRGGMNWGLIATVGLGVGILILLLGIAFLLGRRHPRR